MGVARILGAQPQSHFTWAVQYTPVASRLVRSDRSWLLVSSVLLTHLTRYAWVADVRPSVVRPFSYPSLGYMAVVIDDRPVTPYLRDIDSPLASAQQTIRLGWRVERKAQLQASFISQLRYSSYMILYYCFRQV